MPGGVLLLALLAAAAIVGSSPANATVSYDHRAVVINGQRRILMSGSIHYPRSPPDMWPDLIAKAKEGGLNTIESYVFWNIHEPEKGVVSAQLPTIFFHDPRMAAWCLSSWR